MTLKLKSTTNEIWKGWKLAWYHHFIHIACARKLRGLRPRCTSCTKQTICFEVSGFHKETRLLQHAFHCFTCNCSDILDQRHHHNSCGQKVFTFSSLVSFAYIAVTMDNLHRLTGCLGQPWLWREEFHETFHIVQTCLSCPPLPWCLFSLKQVCGSLAHRMMYSLPYLIFFSVW